MWYHNNLLSFHISSCGVPQGSVLSPLPFIIRRQSLFQQPCLIWCPWAKAIDCLFPESSYMHQQSDKSSVLTAAIYRRRRRYIAVDSVSKNATHWHCHYNGNILPSMAMHFHQWRYIAVNGNISPWERKFTVNLIYTHGCAEPPTATYSKY